MPTPKNTTYVCLQYYHKGALDCVLYLARGHGWTASRFTRPMRSKTAIATYAQVLTQHIFVCRRVKVVRKPEFIRLMKEKNAVVSGSHSTIERRTD